MVLLAIMTLPYMCIAQDVGLLTNYKSKKQERLLRLKPYKSGDLIVSAGFSSVSKGMGGMINFGAEYMFNSKLGLRASYSSNNLSGGLRSWGYSRYSLDLMYHFIQKKRWDVYAFAGIGAERYNYGRFYKRTEIFNSSRAALNAGVGARYKVTPNFGMQLELGRISSFGIHKKFSLKKK